MRQARAALGAENRVEFLGIAVVVVVQAVHEHPDVPRRGVGVQQRFAQLFFLRRVGGQALGQRQFAADLCGVQRVVQRVVERLLFGDAQAVDDAFQRHALALFARVGLQKEPLQVVPVCGPALVQPDKEQVLFQYRHVVQAPLGQFGVGAGPVDEFLQPLAHRQAAVQIALRQAGDLGDVVL